jgi:hypothetical protein
MIRSVKKTPIESTCAEFCSVWFMLLIIGLSSRLPASLAAGLEAHGVPAATANNVADLPPVSVIFAAFLGYNPLEHLLGANVLGNLSPANLHVITSRTYFPQLIADPFRAGLHQAFAVAMLACLIGAFASAARGRRYIADDDADRSASIAFAAGAD